MDQICLVIPIPGGAERGEPGAGHVAAEPVRGLRPLGGAERRGKVVHRVLSKAPSASALVAWFIVN